MRTLPLAAILVVAALAAPAVASPLEADHLDLRGNQVHAGRTQGVSLQAMDGGIEALTVTASAGYLLRWQQDGVFVTCLAGPCDDVSQTLPVEDEPRRVPAEGSILDLQATLLAAAQAHQMNVVPLDHGGLRMHISNGQSRWSSHGDVCLTQAGLATGPDRPVCDGYREAGGTFSNVALGQVQVYDAAEGSLTLRGNMSLEMRGLALESSAGTLDTRDQREPGLGGQFARVFGRLVLVDATLEVTLGPGADVQWAMQRGKAEAFGAALTGAGDRVRFEGRDIDLAAGERLEGDFVVISEAGPRMAFTVHPAATVPGDAAPAAPAWSLWLLTLLFVPLAAVRLRGRATMQGIEAALAKGRFARARRLSDRILAQQPLHESAQLSRAIALTKAGKPEAAVAGVRSFLQKAEPHDGTLHFVLGMALLELGQQEEARDALDIAVQRTPALLAEVAPSLRPSGPEAAYT